jgi:hypothetical protein
MITLGILPCAGAASRFHGIDKEILPIREDVLLMDYSVRALKNCDQILVVTIPDKASKLARIYPDLLFAIQILGSDIWGAVYRALQIQANRYFLAMPDTILPETAFSVGQAAIEFGIFETTTPERFGVLDSQERMIRDKDESLRDAMIPFKAWGTIAFSREVADLWLDRDIRTFDQALTLAMQNFNYSTFTLEFYKDIASLDDYREAIKLFRDV